MKTAKKKRLVYELLLFVIPILITSIVITSAALSYTSYIYFRKTVSQDYKNIIRSSAGEISNYMDSARSGIESLALTISATKLSEWQKDISLTAFHHLNPQFTGLSLISKAGKVILATSTEGCQIGFLKDEAFSAALRGKTAVSKLFMSKSNTPHLHIAAPITHLGETEEVLFGELDLKSVWDVINGIRVGKTGQVFIMDSSGDLIGHREIEKVVRNYAQENKSVIKSIMDSPTPVEWSRQENGETVHCTGYLIPSLNWIMVLTQPHKEIYSYLYDNLATATLVSVIICLLATALVFWRTRRFLRPVESLHKQVQAFGQGRLDQRMELECDNEIGDLGCAFNDMADSLKDYVARQVESAKELAHARNLAALGTASSKVTHEIGNFLSNISISLTMLKKEALSSQGKEVLDIIEKDSLRVREFIKRFLQFARKPDIRLKKIQAETVIKEVISSCRSKAEDMNIQLNLEWPAEIPEVDMDAGLMYQALLNLVRNSIEAFSGPGKVGIRGFMADGCLNIEISDNGPGIKPEHLERIFDPFFTTKSTGTGLGMPIVKTIVEAHNGTVFCQTDEGKGTTCTVKLPIM